MEMFYGRREEEDFLQTEGTELSQGINKGVKAFLPTKSPGGQNADTVGRRKDADADEGGPALLMKVPDAEELLCLHVKTL